jgi:glycosyltransferase involved in cell wall biosynthesis
MRSRIKTMSKEDISALMSAGAAAALTGAAGVGPDGMSPASATAAAAARATALLRRPRKIAFLGNYLPRKCGIATFTHDLRNAVAQVYPDIKCVVIAMNDLAEGYAYPDDVKFTIAEQDPVDYVRAADWVNNTDVDVVCVQHEYGIFGGPCGALLLNFLRALRVPVVTTLHTILQEPNMDQRRILEAITRLSSRVITMAEVGRRMLQTIYHCEPSKIALVPHGIPEMDAVDSQKIKAQLNLAGHPVVLTFGLLSPNKGIEYAIRAIAQVVRKVPDVLYVVLGQTHPALIREHGEAYRNSLEWLAKDLGITQNVRFVNSFVELPLLMQYISACDVYLTPYLHEAQITSGALSYAFGMGTAVVSTPYWHAAELLGSGRGRIVPFRDADRIAQEVGALLADDGMRGALKAGAFEHGRTMTWGNSAKHYMTAFEAALQEVQPALLLPDPEHSSLPALRFDHLHRMTDSTGLLQHAAYSLPDFRHGYCTDDNARALILIARLRSQHLMTPALEQLATSYAAFLNYAWCASTKKFRNFMSYGRAWMEDVGSDDSNGRAMQALGACVRFGLFPEWAGARFLESIEICARSRSLRTAANLLLGIHDFLKARHDDTVVRVRDELAHRLHRAYTHSQKGPQHSNQLQQWNWFEDILSYENALLPHALMLAGDGMQNKEMIDAGLEALEWLMVHQIGPDGTFQPIGNEHWFVRGGRRSHFDQQPLEAGSSALACVCAARISGQSEWNAYAYAAFNWFVGGNVLGKPLYNARTGGCRDGLHQDRVNENEGAESLLAFLLSLLELKRRGLGKQHALPTTPPVPSLSAFRQSASPRSVDPTVLAPPAAVDAAR